MLEFQHHSQADQEFLLGTCTKFCIKMDQFVTAINMRRVSKAGTLRAYVLIVYL